MRLRRFLIPWLGASFTITAVTGAIFTLPTQNKAIFKPGSEAQYFVPTPGRTWESGTFGCVRTEGWQMHEGLDIKCVSRDKKGEPADEVFAAASGRVAYLNNNPGLSNYGRYIVLQHSIEGMQIFTLYAHLNHFAEGLKTGATVRQGQVIAIMGRTSNTRQGISKERGHLHFEIDLQLNDRFAQWHAQHLKGQRNDHGNWNGRNFAGLDPRKILIQQEREGAGFSLAEFIRQRTELCRVLVRDTKFPLLKNCTPLIRRNPKADSQGVAGYEIAIDFNGVPFQLIPRSPSEIGKGARVELLSVNAREQSANPCRKLVVKRKGNWELTRAGEDLFQLITY